MTWSKRTVLVVVLVHAVAVPANAQARLSIGGGIAIPGGLLGANRSFGPIARLSVGSGSTTAATTFRLDGEVAHMPGGGGSTRWRDASFTSFAAIANLIAAWPGERAPYVLVGAGIQRLHVPDEPNPYGVTPGLRAGIGMRTPLNEKRLSLEIAAHLNVTDFAAGAYSLGYFFPVIAALRF